MASRREAERWLALEFVGAVVVRTIAGFREQDALLGPQNYAAIMIAYGMLSVLVLSDTTADLAAVFGALLLLAILLRPTETGTAGSAVAEAFAAFNKNVRDNPTSIARGVPVKGGAKASSASTTADVIPASFRQGDPLTYTGGGVTSGRWV